MKITNKEELFNNVSIGDTIHLINPFGCGVKIQGLIKIYSVQVLSFEKDKVNVIDLSSGVRGCNFYGDLFKSEVKSLFTDYLEAQKELILVKEGKYIDEVGSHHSGCRGSVIWRFYK